MMDLIAKWVLPFAIGALAKTAFDRVRSDEEDDDIRPRVLDMRTVDEAPVKVIDAAADIYDDIAAANGITDGSLSLAIDLRNVEGNGGVQIAALYAPTEPDLVFLLPGTDEDGDPITTDDPEEAKAAILAIMAASPVPIPVVEAPPIGLRLSPEQLQQIKRQAERQAARTAREERRDARRGALGLMQ